MKPVNIKRRLNGTENTSRNESNGAMSVLSGKIQTKGAIPMNLSTISTAELVKELFKREAVQKMTVEPYQSYQITVGKHTVSDTGPVVILRIWD